MRIPLSCRIRNRTGNRGGGECVWAAAETAALAAGYESVRGVTIRAVAEGFNGASCDNVVQMFENFGIPCEHSSRPDDAFFKRAIAEGVGCYFEVPGHAMVLVGMDDQGVRYINNNGPPVVKCWTLREFRQNRSGGACFPRKPHPSPNPNVPHEPTIAPLPTPVDPPKPIDPPKPVPPAVTAADLEKLKGDILTAVVVELKKLPAGPKGDAGPAGAVGPAGPAGAKGSDGLAGKDADPAAVKAIQDQIAQIKSQGFTVEIVDENGKPIDSGYVTLGGTLRLRLQKSK